MHGRTIMMHRVVTDTQGFENIVDHIDHNGLNNRQYNLRVTETDKNSRHREHKNCNNKSGYRNVFWNTNMGKWSVDLCKDYKRIHIGEFDDVDEAGRIAEEARHKYYGKFAGGN